ncbi:MAG TPA: hypothetical protein VGU27_00040, partial [Candidatus Eisenbacteria bacterium]|nr:hypothetical protein [Candidatus Eisenbacteria bacterium]
MLVAIAFARPDVAAADSRGAGLAATSLAEWLAEPGRPGWLADDALGTALPPAIAGLIAGGVAARDPFAPIALPWPGIAEAQVPLAWYDSSAVVIGEDAAWRGFGAALEEARGFASPPSDRRARAVATVLQGTSAMDRNGLLVSRGDAHAWLRAGAVGDRRGGAGALGPAADHVWLAQGGLTRGQHHWRASYAQRGEGAEQTTGFRDGGHGEDAELAWQWSGRHGTLGATITRGTDIRDSDEPGAALDLGAHRAAQQTGVAVEAARGDSAHRDGVRLELADAHVTRLEASPVFRPEPAVAWAERSAWLAARAQRPLGGGALELAL